MKISNLTPSPASNEKYLTKLLSINWMTKYHKHLLFVQLNPVAL